MNIPSSPAAVQTRPHNAMPRSRARVWLKRSAFSLLALLIALPFTGVIYQLIATRIDQANYPLPGQMMDVGGYRLHLLCMGENTGGRPTVILEAGLGATSSVWAWIQPEIAQSTRVCAYDRAGMGGSEPSSEPHDAQHIAAGLHTLLQNAHTPGPYVLVGWSYGGLYARTYAGQYSEEVAGLVLLDSSSPEQCTSTPGGKAQCASMARLYSIAPALARMGILRVMGLFQPASGLPNPQSEAFLAASSATKDWVAQSAEYLASPATNSQVLGSPPLGALPLFVLTATEHGTPPDLEILWQGWQTGFTGLSTNSVQRIVSGATHASLILDSTDAKASIDAILQVVEAARTGQPLARK
jgi:pimeloyl-ACP methyl ester carboxylesterase